MNTSRLVGAGTFVVLGVVLFTAALFMIGERRNLFQKRFTVYTEYATLGQLDTGAIVRVSGLDGFDRLEHPRPLRERAASGAVLLFVNGAELPPFTLAALADERLLIGERRALRLASPA